MVVWDIGAFTEVGISLAWDLDEAYPLFLRGTTRHSTLSDEQFAHGIPTAATLQRTFLELQFRHAIFARCRPRLPRDGRPLAPSTLAMYRGCSVGAFSLLAHTESFGH